MSDNSQKCDISSTRPVLKPFSHSRIMLFWYISLPVHYKSCSQPWTRSIQIIFNWPAAAHLVSRYLLYLSNMCDSEGYLHFQSVSYAVNSSADEHDRTDRIDQNGWVHLLDLFIDDRCLGAFVLRVLDVTVYPLSVSCFTDECYGCRSL